MCVKWSLHPWYLMIWGPRVPGSLTVWSETHSRLSEKRHSSGTDSIRSLDQISLQHTRRHHVSLEYRRAVVSPNIKHRRTFTQLQGQHCGYNQDRIPPWAEHFNDQVSSLVSEWKEKIIINNECALFKWFCAKIVLVRRGLFNPWHFSCVQIFFHLYIETVMEYNPEASRDGIKAKGIWVIATIKCLPGLVEL